MFACRFYFKRFKLLLSLVYVWDGQTLNFQRLRFSVQHQNEIRWWQLHPNFPFKNAAAAFLPLFNAIFYYFDELKLGKKHATSDDT